ncbi:MAG: DDE-type integrase/transposase/recombinase [Clostridiales bacterium]|jgi:transposase InsO family protein|nr:DDE-type integrase/transposase/recombinase [Clostridiales bacterium]
MVENRTAEETAENRFKVITPVLVAMEENVDDAKLAQIKKTACEQSGISQRTLGRWLKGHMRNGFAGLKPIPKIYRGPNVIPEEIIEEAILLRREVPSRSVSQIIEILEMEGKVSAGFIKRTTLQEKLKSRGYSTRHMMLYRQTGVASRRFARLNRNDLWHADIKFGPYITVSGVRKQIYLVSFLDDYSRYVVHAEFYDNLEQIIVEDCLRKAILKEGLPKRVYFDNGKQFRNKWMERACAKLGIKLLFAMPYSPESTGKIERFNRTVDAFLAESKLKKLYTIDGYNHYLKVWLSECYHTKKHGSLMDTPQNVYKMSNTPLHFVEPEVIADAFLHCETRKVDKSGCISFKAKLYDVGLLLIGQMVDVVYDLADDQTITVEHKSTGYSKQVSKLIIGPHAGRRPKLPGTMLPKLSNTSRLLDGKEKQYMKNEGSMRHAIRYSDIDALSINHSSNVEPDQETVTDDLNTAAGRLDGTGSLIYEDKDGGSNV